MERTIIILLSFLALSVSDVFADTIYTAQDKVAFKKYTETVSVNTNSKPQDLIISTASFFLNKPYVGGVLDNSPVDTENLIVNFREFDCTTFVETCLALYSTVKSKDMSLSEYNRQLTQLRYRNGAIDGYCSRLHYSSDWIYENEKRGYWKNISAGLGGSTTDKDINYMSTHPQAYKHLRKNKSNLSQIQKIENNINYRNNYIVIPKGKISAIQHEIQHGDIIFFATSIDGLDYSHMGIAYWIKGELHFIHASSRAKKVIVEPRTLVNYCAGSKSCTGISLLRVN